MRSRLESLIGEARDSGRRPPPTDWVAVDQKLFARIEDDGRAERLRVLTTGRSKGWTVGAFAMAAAVLAVAGGKSRESRSLDAEVAAETPAAGRVAGLGPRAALRVGGQPAALGVTLHLGDTLEVHGGPAMVDRAGELSFTLEDGARATVTHVRGALVLALERGAVEAQVVPVPAGEAFAVDVDGARVAVHGTHLRVARADGGRVAVDLSEGVVVVGSAPRLGSTVGALVTAPAHAEFSARDPEGTLTVDHEPSAIRPAAVTPPAAEVPGRVLAPPVIAKPLDPRPNAPPALGHAAMGSAAAPAPRASASTADKPDPNAGAAIAAAVRSCLAVRANGATVAIEVKTTLHLELDGSGTVRAARFDPPVAPDVNSCAAAAIYKARFAHDGAADVTVDFKAPGSAP